MAMCLMMLCLITSSWANFRYSFDIVDADFDRIAAQMDSIDQRDHINETSMPMLQKLDSIARLRTSNVLQARAMYWQVRCHQYSMPTDTCLRILRQAILLVDSTSYDAARIGYQLAGNLQRSNRLAESWRLLEERVMPQLHACHDDYYLGNAYHLYAMIYRSIGDMKEAETALQSAERHLREGGYPLGKLLFMKALVEDDNQKSTQLYIDAIAEDPTDASIVAQAYTNLAGLAIDDEHPDKAMQYIKEGLQALDTYQPEFAMMRALLLVNKAEVDYMAGRYNEALQTLLDVEQLGGEYMQMVQSAEIHHSISLAYEKTGHIAEAYTYLKAYVNIKQQQLLEIEESKAQRQRDRQTIHDRQQEIIEQLQSEAKRQHIQTAATIGILLLVIAAITIILIRYRKVHRQNEAENKELRDVLQQETVGALLSNTIKDEEERTKAEAQLEQVRPGFFVKLKEINPELTDSDLRLCTYISIGMRAKEIAQHLSVTPDSVNTARYRLRKKLGIQQGEKLDDFLRNL